MNRAEAAGNSKLTQEKRDQLRNVKVSNIDAIEEKVDLATLDAFEDMKQEFIIVPIMGQSGKVHNFVVRHLTAAECAFAYQTAFPKSALQLQKAANESGEVDIDSLSESATMDLLFDRRLAIVKVGIVKPENVTIEQIKSLSGEALETLSNAIEFDIMEDDIISRFPEGDVGPEDAGVSEAEG